MKKGTVYLTGAGPGDPGLCTLRALDYIKNADVIVYDKIGASQLIKNVRPDAELIYVGKECGCHTIEQGQINQILVAKAKENKSVVRLKGGDPFVFGRGAEEAETLIQAGISFEIVPGITSAVSVPAYAGIPVTHRAVNSSFTVITGHEDPGKEESKINWNRMAQLNDTLIILMGINHIKDIAQKLIHAGKSPSTPVAVIENGTLPQQRTVVGNLSNIFTKTVENSIKPPAVCIVGEVVNYRNSLKWFETRPLFGKRVVVTRSRGQASKFSRKLEELGADVLEFPVIKIEPIKDLKNINRAMYDIKSFDWLVFTSVNGVKHFFQHFIELIGDIRILNGIKICAIGPATRDALLRYYLKADIMPKRYIAEEILNEMKDINLEGKKILICRAQIARDILPKGFHSLGANVTVVEVYTTVREKSNTDLLKEKQIDMVTFTSSSTVENFIKTVGKDYLKILSQTKTACIGPITAQSLESYDIKPDIVADEYTIDGLVNAIEKHYLEER